MKYVLMDQAGGDGDGGTGGAAPTGSDGATGEAKAFNWAEAGLDADGLAVIQNKGWKAPADMLGSYRNLEKLIGVPPDQVVKLPKGMDPEKMGEVYDRLGRPKSPDEYGLAADGKGDEYQQQIAKAMHEAGLNTAQAQKLAKAQKDFVAKLTDRQQADYTEKVAADSAALKSKWKDSHDANVMTAQKAAKTFGVTESQVAALEKELGFAGVHEFFYNIGARLGEAEFVDQGGNRNDFSGASPTMAQSQINELMKDKTFQARFNSNDPSVKAEARSELARLRQIVRKGDS